METQGFVGLRSLEASGGPVGTDRPSSEVPGRPSAGFEGELARELERRPARGSARASKGGGSRDVAPSPSPPDATAQVPLESSPVASPPSPGSPVATIVVQPVAAVPALPVPETGPVGATPPEGGPPLAAQDVATVAVATTDPGLDASLDLGAVAGAVADPPAPDAAQNPLAARPEGRSAPQSQPAPPAAPPQPPDPAAPAEAPLAGDDAGLHVLPGAETADAVRPASATHGAGDGPGSARAEGAREPAASAAPRPPAAPMDLARAERVLEQVRVHLAPAARSATLQLQPAELGRISIRLGVEDGAVTAVVRAEQPETLAILERHVPELRAILAQGGIEVAELEFGLAERGLADQRGDLESRGDGGRRAAARASESPAESPGLDLDGLAREVAARGGVDTWA